MNNCPLIEFNIVDFLKDEESIDIYLGLVLKDGNPFELGSAFQVISEARLLNELRKFKGTKKVISGSPHIEL